ncbi:hypothetical protein GA0061078_1225 [Bifidobacterium bohemicum]|uniref:Uncharacterized protein n=1 Tax=Bifidobacterium bohemicum DSM 22767 TaxID=1437606 RepID=A0A086ZG81_9BIFI|nr:hypothetical protein [Bifidobacterium bohemicum]KFI45531.1 hypothetical protein BBOH_1058 [Bifidobacterium bohemicum DSM 22767]SCC02703.1 hypothetical protein GA0061078_1225 [Bifidobacterium bohemicum]
MTFSARISWLEDVDAALKSTCDRLEADVEVAKAQNKKSLEGNNGAWADAAAQKFMTLQTGMDASLEGINRLQKQCSGAVEELKGTLVSRRDGLLEAAGTSASERDEVVCESGAGCKGAADDVVTSLRAFHGSVNRADGAVGSLVAGSERNDIASALNRLGNDVLSQIQCVDSISSRWVAFVDAVDAFETKYSAEFAKPLVDEKSMGAARDEINRMVLERIASVKNKEDAKDSIEWLARLMVLDAGIAKQLRDDYGDDVIVDQLIAYAKGKVPWKEVEWKRLVKDTLKVVQKHKTWQALDHPKAEHAPVKGGGSLGGFLGKASNSVLDHFGFKYEDGRFTAPGWKEVGDAFKEGGKLGAIKGAGKAVLQGADAAGSVLTVVGTVCDVYNSYVYTQGDNAQKVAASITVGVSDLIEIGITAGVVKGVTFITGDNVLLGAVAGAGAGMILGRVKDTDRYKSGEKAVEDGLAGMLRQAGV